jgi:heparinase II/III-like protein/uncharacterized protein DUF4962
MICPRTLLLFAVLPVLLVCGKSNANAASGAELPPTLKTLRPSHPRLMVTAEQFDQLKQVIKTDDLAGRWEKKLLADAEKMLGAPPVEHVLIGPRLLDKSRTALSRVSTLAALYRLTGDKRFADRAKKELFTVAAFKDWNPSHFLDVAEMTNAVALGYDWLYDELSPQERATLRRAIVELGLKPGLVVYKKNNWWAAATHNWNQVCNGGMTVGALAIADEEPQLAAQIIEYGRKSIPKAMASFAPDGGWAEGPGYWGYATEYNVFYLAALQTALGTDFGLKKMPGFAQCGDYRVLSVGPTNLTFNYADAGAGAGRDPQTFWLARTFNRPDYDAFERKMTGNSPSIFALLWFNPQFSSTSQAMGTAPLAKLFKGINVAYLRSDWKDKNAFFVGFKGGDNKANHSHLDLGTFVMDALGQRWAIDLGGDEYNMPGYFGKERFTYYRLKTEGHNTLTFDGGENQNTSAKSPIVAFSAAPGDMFAVADLSQAYRAAGATVMRGMALKGREQIVVEDEIQSTHPLPVTWSMHTNASVKPDGKTATLSQGNAQLRATLLSPQGAAFAVEEVNLQPPQKPSPNTRKLVVHLDAKSPATRIVVVFTPADAGAQLPKVVPLKDWHSKN